LLLLIIFVLECRYCIDASSQEIPTDKNGNNDNNNFLKLENQVTLDVASAAMARRLIKRMKEVQDAAAAAAATNDNGNDVVVRQSWDTLIQLLDHLASSSSSSEQNTTTTTLQNIHHHHLTQNESRKRALYWLSHQDTYDQKETGTGFLHRYALAVIYFSLEGDSWNRCSSSSHSGTGSILAASPCPSDNERYLSSTSHRLWDGINGNRDDTITWLDLSNRNVYSEQFLPLEFTLLSPTLELVWISENPDLSGTLPDYMGEFQKLESFNVHKTNVGGTLPTSLYTLRKLSSLRLYKSNFTGSISSEIGNMGRLKWLWIHENKFTGVVPEEMGGLKKLEGVTLHGNQFVPIVVDKKKEEEEVQEEEEEKLANELLSVQLQREEEVVVQKNEEEEEEETPKENRNLRRMLTDVDEKEGIQLEGLNHHKKMIEASDMHKIENAYEDAAKTDLQPKPNEENDADVTQNNEEKQEDESTTTETQDWTSTLKGNIIPESLCSLMTQKKLKHLWTDCEEDALDQNGQDGGSDLDLVIKEGVHACSCCTRCFPKKDQKANIAAVG